MPDSSSDGGGADGQPAAARRLRGMLSYPENEGREAASSWCDFTEQSALERDAAVLERQCVAAARRRGRRRCVHRRTIQLGPGPKSGVKGSKSKVYIVHVLPDSSSMHRLFGIDGSDRASLRPRVLVLQPDSWTGQIIDINERGYLLSACTVAALSAGCALPTPPGHGFVLLLPIHAASRRALVGVGVGGAVGNALIRFEADTIFGLAPKAGDAGSASMEATEARGVQRFFAARLRTHGVPVATAGRGAVGNRGRCRSSKRTTYQLHAVLRSRHEDGFGGSVKPEKVPLLLILTETICTPFTVKEHDGVVGASEDVWNDSTAPDGAAAFSCCGDMLESTPSAHPPEWSADEDAYDDRQTVSRAIEWRVRMDDSGMGTPLDSLGQTRNSLVARGIGVGGIGDAHGAHPAPGPVVHRGPQRLVQMLWTLAAIHADDGQIGGGGDLSVGTVDGAAAEIVSGVIDSTFSEDEPVPSERHERACGAETRFSLLVAERLAQMKDYAPSRSLLGRLASCTMAAVHCHRGDVDVPLLVREIWTAFVRELQRRFEAQELLCHVRTDARPDVTSSLMHQKLVMLQQSILRAGRPPAETEAPTLLPEGARGVLPELGGAGRVSSQADADPGTGAARRVLYVPITQEAPWETEEEMEQGAIAMELMRDGASEMRAPSGIDGARADAGGSGPDENPEVPGALAERRRRYGYSYCKSLVSDMSAFKSVNVDSSFADFVRWFSPRDYDADRFPDGVSPRMAGEDNVWMRMWLDAPACAAVAQKPLQDWETEGFKALHYFETIREGELLRQLVAAATTSVVSALAEHSFGSNGRAVNAHLEDDRNDAGGVVRRAVLAAADAAVAFSMRGGSFAPDNVVSAGDDDGVSSAAPDSQSWVLCDTNRQLRELLLRLEDAENEVVSAESLSACLDAFGLGHRFAELFERGPVEADDQEAEWEEDEEEGIDDDSAAHVGDDDERFSTASRHPEVLLSGRDGRDVLAARRLAQSIREAGSEERPLSIVYISNVVDAAGREHRMHAERRGRDYSVFTRIAVSAAQGIG